MKPTKHCSFFTRWLIWGVHMPRFTLKNKHFLTYVLGNTINVCWYPENRACFSDMIDLRGNMPRFTLKMNVFHLSPEKPHKCVMKPIRIVLIFLRQSFWEVTCLDLLWKMNMFSHLYPRRHYKCVLKPSEQGSCFPRWSIWVVHMPRFTLKLNVFPSISWEMSLGTL